MRKKPPNQTRCRTRALCLVLSLCQAGCPITDSDTTGSVDPSIEGPSDPSPVVVLPPGGLVDTQPQSGWTEGRLHVSDDGVASYSIPLWVPDGRRGLSPQLGLRYSSRGGNGPLGVGWSISGMSSIQPCPRTVAHNSVRLGVSFSDNDVYCLDGALLRYVAALPNGDIEYRTEENPFDRIISHALNGGIDHFTVERKDGQILTYGGVQNATLVQTRMVGVDAEDPRLEAQAQPARTRWLLRRIEDRNGNRVLFEYERRESVTENHAVEILPRRIRYEPGRVIEFVYDENRDDVIDGFQSGGPTGSVHHRLSRRLVAIRAFGPSLLREYRLSYETEGQAQRCWAKRLTS